MRKCEKLENEEIIIGEKRLLMTEDLFANNIVLQKSFQFALEIIVYCEELEFKKKFIIAKQLLKSGTSVGANVNEAQHAESNDDFIHKMKIAIKEAEETKYWLLLCQYSASYPKNENLILKVEVLIKIISEIIITSKNKKK